MRCSELEKETRSVKEKEKGNEAFHAGDLHEAIAYYSRSLQLMPTAITYNNRAVVGENSDNNEDDNILCSFLL